MKIIVDLMGADNSPDELLKGTLDAAEETEAEFILVGNRSEIERIASENGYDIHRYRIIDTKDNVIGMDDSPMSAIKGKKDSSMGVALKMLAEDRGDAVVSAGNSGALFTGASVVVRRIKGVKRPAFATVMPFSNPVLLLDSGANIDVNDDSLEQFAIMGSVYMNYCFGIGNPRVGLLNIGTEPCKGRELQIDAFKKLSASDKINFVGNIESNILPFGVCDVLVTDGFTGNILLKSIEGMGKLMADELKNIFYESNLTKLSGLLVKTGITRLKQRYDVTEYGGAPILGIQRPVIKAHGSSNAKAFKSAIKQAVTVVKTDLTGDMIKELK